MRGWDQMDYDGDLGRKWTVQLLANGCFLYAPKGSGVPGPRGIMAGQSSLIMPTFHLGVLLVLSDEMFPLVRLAPYIRVPCCPLYYVIGWLADLLGVTSPNKFRLSGAVSFYWK